MPDPYEPGWRPEYVGDSHRGDVGSGSGFGADLYELYKAGRLTFPYTAATYAEMAIKVHGVAGRARRLFEVDGYLEPAHQLLLKLRGDLQDVLRQSAVNIEDSGVALVEIAESYAATDEAAAAEMASLMDENHHDFEQPPVRVPEAPARGAPTPPPDLDERRPFF